MLGQRSGNTMSVHPPNLARSRVQPELEWRWRMAIAHRTHSDSDDAEVIELTPTEYDRAVANALDSLGLTYDQLAEQACRADFVSLRARQVWLLIGDLSHD